MTTACFIAIALCLAVNAIEVKASDGPLSPERLSSLKKEITSLRQNIAHLTGASTNNVKHLHPAPKVQQKKQVFYGFTAFANVEEQYDEGETIQFHETIINIGNGFNTGTGIFTCPTSGYYYFVVHLYNSSGRDIGASIVKSSEDLTKAYINTGQTQYRKSSTSVVQQCNQGEQVSVVCRDNGDLEGNSNAETTFSGFLITEP